MTLLPEATRKIKNNPTGWDALADIQQGIEGATWLLLTAYSKVWEKKKKKGKLKEELLNIKDPGLARF